MSKIKEVTKIKILNDSNQYAIWCIDEDEGSYYRISLEGDRGRITTISKWNTYTKKEDPNYLYSDNIIKLKSYLPFAFANFKTIVME